MNKSRFHFDARNDGPTVFPIPKSLPASAANLLTDFLWLAFEASPQFRVLDHVLKRETTKQLEDDSFAILAHKFVLPCEGCDVSIATVDRIALFPREIKFKLNDVFAAHVASSALPSQGLLAVFRPNVPRLALLDEEYLPLVVESVQKTHYLYSVLCNEAAIHALRNGRLAPPREMFRLDRLEALLMALGASPAP